VAIALVVAINLAGAILISGSINPAAPSGEQMAQRVQSGDLSASVSVETQDEVGMLARTFNTMTEGLRERERERDIFGRVVSPEVREKLLTANSNSAARRAGWPCCFPTFAIFRPRRKR